MHSWRVRLEAPRFCVSRVNRQTNTTHTKHFSLYTLRLEQNKYYVGITTMTDPYKRIAQHENGFYGARWTKKYKPVETIEIRDLGNITQVEAEDYENRQTLEYMQKYGHQNVIGGKFNFSGRYFKLGSRYFREEDWWTMLVSAIAMLTIKTLK